MRQRNRLRAVAAETVDILERGTYGTVDIRERIARAVAGTRLYLPDDALPSVTGETTAAIEVTGETTLAAAARLPEPLCLNFASARKPGGGFLSGAQAQEESLARGSALYPTLRAAGEFYAFHRDHPELTYSDRVIYSPAVPVFRADSGQLLPRPYDVSFVTAAAPNAGALARNQPHLLPQVPDIVERRARRVLAVAAAHGHRTLVLGAWGCGVFANDPHVVATAFRNALRAAPWFERVVFAVLDTQPGTPTRAAFADVFAEGQ